MAEGLKFHKPHHWLPQDLSDAKRNGHNPITRGEGAKSHRTIESNMIVRSLSRCSPSAINSFPKVPSNANSSQLVEEIPLALIHLKSFYPFLALFRCIRSFESKFLPRDDRSCGCRLRICFPTHGACWNILLVMALDALEDVHTICFVGAFLAISAPCVNLCFAGRARAGVCGVWISSCFG